MSKLEAKAGPLPPANSVRLLGLSAHSKATESNDERVGATGTRTVAALNVALVVAESNDFVRGTAAGTSSKVLKPNASNTDRLDATGWGSDISTGAEPVPRRGSQTTQETARQTSRAEGRRPLQDDQTAPVAA